MADLSKQISKDFAYCEDTISRQAAVDAIYHHLPAVSRTRARTMLHEVPSAQPERKKGKWVHGREIAREMVGDAVTAIFYEGWQCSECKCIVEEEREPLWNFCPSCGADMRGEQDGRDN